MILLWLAPALACDTGPACYAEAVAALETDPATALIRYDQGCTLGHARSCWKQANLLVDGDRVSPDPDRAETLRERAFTLAEADCARSDAACTTLALIWYWGIGVESKDAVEADALLHRACDAGDGEGCHWAAILSRQCLPAFLHRYPFSEYCTEDDDDAGVRALLERSCTLGDPEGCVALARHLRERYGDATASGQALAAACALGDDDGCLRHARHDLVHGDAADARARLSTLCLEATSPHLRTTACAAAVAHAPDGQALLEQACGTDGACWHDQGRILRTGAHGLPSPDVDLGELAEARACALGEALACPSRAE